MNQPIDVRALWLSALLWMAAFLVPFPTPPMTLFANQWLAVIGWGLLLCASSGSATRLLPATAWAVLATVLLLAGAAGVQHRWLDVLLLLLAGAVFAFGLCEDSASPLRALWWALLVAGLLSALIGTLQVLAPQTAGTALVANLLNAGRAAGNLRQTNLLATLLALALAALVVLSTARATGSRVWPLLAAGLLGGCIEFSASRTGILELCLVVAWAVFDRSLPRSARALALAAVLGFIAAVGLQWLAAPAIQGGVPAWDRLGEGGGGTRSRLSIWSDVMVLIGREPWTGVGWGNLSKAWALSEFPARYPVAFDHAHNIVLQLAVELGVPAALACLAVVAAALWRARVALMPAEAVSRAPAHAVALMLLLFALHSMLEYPLWYAFFLLPAAYLLGVFVRLGELARSEAVSTPRASWRPAVQAVGVLTVLGALFTAWDYARVLQVYAPFGRGLRETFEQRVETGRRSVFFGALADYGLVTSAEHPGTVMPAFERPLRYLVNARLLLAYARALDEHGDMEKARYVAARLREFRSPLSKEFFAACEVPEPASATPFQCVAPGKAFTYRDFP